MSAIVEAFKIKPFDLEPIYASWPSPPVFRGEPKDLPVDTWLEQIKSGCVERKVPKEYWNKVAQHNLGPKAKERFDELKLVMSKVHGGKYRWNWKRFKVAMRNMGWDIDPKKTEGIKVATKPSGLWWIVGKEKNASQTSLHSSVSSEKVSGSSTPASSSSLKPLPPIPETTEQQSTSYFWPLVPKRRSSSSSTTSTSETALTPSATPIATPSDTVTSVKQVPTWLLNACNALEFLSVEHPKAMTTISAVLITVGSLPAIPAIAGGAGGAVLASHAIQAAGAIAVGLGNWLKFAQESAQQQHQQQSQSSAGQASIEECKEK